VNKHERQELTALRDAALKLRAEYMRLKRVHGLPASAHALIVVVDPVANLGATVISDPIVLRPEVALENMIADSREQLKRSTAAQGLAQAVIKLSVGYSDDNES